jgi:hypothetical protein
LFIQLRVARNHQQGGGSLPNQLAQTPRGPGDRSGLAPLDLGHGQGDRLADGCGEASQQQVASRFRSCVTSDDQRGRRLFVGWK